MAGLFLMLFGWLNWVVDELGSPTLWLTADSDDFRHLPRHQGHPRRSTRPVPEEQRGIGPSKILQRGMDGFMQWHLEDPTLRPVTLFVIGDQVEDETFAAWLTTLLDASDGITIGCHGMTHRSWSAWPADPDGLKGALEESFGRIHDVVGDAWRPWFRAPAGYIAPWMAEVLALAGITLDSSVNPSRLVARKTGGGPWRRVIEAMTEAGIVERPWMTTRFGPACGPALHLPILSGPARRAWMEASNCSPVNESELLNRDSEVVTLYWHLLDHARKKGRWTPPLRHPPKASLVESQS